MRKLVFGLLVLVGCAISSIAEARHCVSWDQRCSECTVCDERDKKGNCLRSHVEKCNCGTVCLEWAEDKGGIPPESSRLSAGTTAPCSGSANRRSF